MKKEEAEQAILPASWLNRVVTESKAVGDTKKQEQDEDTLKSFYDSEAGKLIYRYWDNKLIGLRRSLSESVASPSVTAEEIGMRYLILDQVEDLVTKFKSYVERPIKADLAARASDPAPE